jgi:hypothetical protein
MGMIMDENNYKVYNEDVISCKCNYSIIAKLSRVWNSCKWIGYFLGDLLL